MSGRQLDDEYWDRIEELQEYLIRAMADCDIIAVPFDGDIIVKWGHLSGLLEFVQEHRSEIEELG